MSNTVMIPDNVLEGRGTPFPVGSYVSAENEVKVSASEDKKSINLLLTLRSVTPVDGQDVGKRPMSLRIPVVVNEKSVVDIAEFTTETPYPLQVAARLLGGLAIAVGAAQKTEGGVAVDLQSFLEELETGIYSKAPIGFEVFHRSYKTKQDKEGQKTGVAADIARFFAAS